MDLSILFDSVAGRLGVGHASASFSQFADLKHTWRRSGRSASFKVSDYLDGAPEDVMESLAWYLVSRAFDVECPDGRSRKYLEYLTSSRLWESKRALYLSRSQNLSLQPRGRCRDLGSVFEYVNSTYFKGKIRHPTLAWVKESPAVRLGYYFEPLNLLAVNSVLDSERVPRYVLEFVVYHELLHYIDAEGGRRTKRVKHTKRFREQERMFSSWKDSERWLSRLVVEHKLSKKTRGVPRV